MVHRCFIPAAFLLLIGVNPHFAAAQAWVPPKGEGSVAVLYQNLFVRDHFDKSGSPIRRGEIQSDNLLFDVTYGLTDRIAVTFALPLIRSRYSGAFPHPTSEDNGAAHSGFQNVRFGVRYNIVDGPLTITPFVGSSVPSHSYEYFAHAAYGTRVRELEVGTYVGRMLGPILPKAFVQARYAYSFAERIEDIHHDRSNLDVEFGYFLSSRVRAFVVGAGQTTHGGIDTPDAGWRAMPANLGPHHDRVARLQMLDFGGGIQVSLSRSFDVFGSFMKTSAGRNSHSLARGFTVGAAWSFGGGGGGIGALGPPDSPEDSLGKCLCQK
jgi:hypothetical protein